MTTDTQTKQTDATEQIDSAAMRRYVERRRECLIIELAECDRFLGLPRTIAKHKKDAAISVESEIFL